MCSKTYQSGVANVLHATSGCIVTWSSTWALLKCYRVTECQYLYWSTDGWYPYDFHVASAFQMVLRCISSTHRRRVDHVGWRFISMQKVSQTEWIICQGVCQNDLQSHHVTADCFRYIDIARSYHHRQLPR